MKTLCVINDELNECVDSTLKTFYRNKIKSPIFVVKNDRLKNCHGLHGWLNFHTYKKRVHRMSDEFMEHSIEFYGGWFHYISLSGIGIKQNKKRLHETSAHWIYEKIYGVERAKKYPLLCWLNATLTHEVHHAWQRDKGVRRVKHHVRKPIDTLDPYWWGNMYEYDAEVEANKMRDRTLTHMINV